MSKVFVREDGCWIFTGAQGGKRVNICEDAGYGVIWRGGNWKDGARQIGAHVASYMVHIGPVPPGMCVCHNCDVTTCVNPALLFLGTIADNNQDMKEKDRRRTASDWYHGEMSSRATLKNEQVAEIKFLLEEGRLTPDEIAALYGTTFDSIRNIKHGWSWKRVQPAASVSIKYPKVSFVRRI
jgi:hypothetical protein